MRTSYELVERWRGNGVLYGFWIPASAGMTWLGAGMTWLGAGMTWVWRRDDVALAWDDVGLAEDRRALWILDSRVRGNDAAWGGNDVG